MWEIIRVAPNFCAMFWLSTFSNKKFEILQFCCNLLKNSFQLEQMHKNGILRQFWNFLLKLEYLQHLQFDVVLLNFDVVQQMTLKVISFKYIQNKKRAKTHFYLRCTMKKLTAAGVFLVFRFFYENWSIYTYDKCCFIGLELCTTTRWLWKWVRLAVYVFKQTNFVLW